MELVTKHTDFRSVSVLLTWTIPRQMGHASLLVTIMQRETAPLKTVANRKFCFLFGLISIPKRKAKCCTGRFEISASWAAYTPAVE